MLMYILPLFMNRAISEKWLADFLIICGIFSTYLVIMQFAHKNYRVRVDEDFVCWRKVGFNRSEKSEIAVGLGDFSALVAEVGTHGMNPFEAVFLFQDAEETPSITLSRQYLRDADIAELLQLIIAESDPVCDPLLLEFIANQ
ncbi:hypothetical protein [Alteraurantiacibacter aestuarii]|uniref:Uncharacterized protein n=2 Tax=Alteraurantiacibacter aestuarii TaxID=650004 RepID=A0A844ZLP2_9SPHN|nr:hypothetical protein [Alteraurantiacibacter aestuarii]